MIRLKEQDIHYIIKESIRSLLTESQESKSISEAKKLLIQRLGYSSEQADEFVRYKLRNDIPSLKDKKCAKFILGATRMFLDKNLRTANDILSLDTTIKYISTTKYIDDFNRNLNGLSCQQLIDIFKEEIQKMVDAEKDTVNNMSFETPSDYDIVRIDNYEQANQYHNYTDWCVTNDIDAFNTYTCDGINQFYFCLKHGFENIPRPREVGDDAPLDEYGKSMIAVLVNENGSLNACTCRWNHDNGGDDHVLRKESEVSELIGVNFFDTFKPNNKWNNAFENAMNKIKNGGSVETSFDYAVRLTFDVYLVTLMERKNIYRKGHGLISDMWFDGISLPTDDTISTNKGFVRVEKNDTYNFINIETGKFLTEDWFDWLTSVFRNGYVCVDTDEGSNFLGLDGKFLLDRFYEITHNFNKYGFAHVFEDEKCNLVNLNGDLVLDKWADFMYTNALCYTIIGYDIGTKWVYNILDENCKLIWKKPIEEWFDAIEGDGAFEENGLAKVYIGDKPYYLNKDGDLLDSIGYYKHLKNY